MTRIIGRLSPRHRSERGAVLVMSVAGIVLALVSASLAVDLGFLASDKRTDQKIADLAALDASRDLAGVAAHCLPPPDASGPDCPAVISAVRNFTGRDAPPAISAELVSPDGQGGWLPDAAGTAVRVTVTSPRKPVFPFVSSATRTVTARAVAGPGNAIGTVRVGSNLVSASGTIPQTNVLMLDKTISALIGGSYSATAVGWKGLADSSVTFGALATALGINAGSTDQVLNSTFTMDQLLGATASVLHNSGNSSVGTSVTGIKNQVNANGTYLNQPLKLYDLFDFGSVVVGNKEDVANANLNVLELIRGGAILADGDHFASFNLTVADLNSVLSPLAMPVVFNGVKVSMGLIEGPRTSFPGPPGKDATNTYYTSAHTSQIRVKLEVAIKVPLAGALSQTLNVPLVGPVTTELLGSGTLVNATFSYYLDAGTAHAYLDAIRCGGASEPTGVDIWGVTDIGTSKLAVVSDTNLAAEATPPLSGSQPILSLLAGLVNVKADGVVTTTIPGNSGVMKTFLPTYDGSTSQEVPGAMLALPTLLDTNLKVDPLVVGLNAGPLISSLVQGINSTGLTFNSSTPGLTTSILKPLYDALGLSFGSADLWAPPVQTCAALSPVGSTGTPPVLKG